MNGSRGGGGEDIGGGEVWVVGGDTVQSITLCIASSPFFLTLVALGLYFAYKASILYSLTPARIGLIQQSLHTPPHPWVLSFLMLLSPQHREHPELGVSHSLSFHFSFRCEVSIIFSSVLPLLECNRVLSYTLNSGTSLFPPTSC